MQYIEANSMCLLAHCEAFFCGILLLLLVLPTLGEIVLLHQQNNLLIYDKKGKKITKIFFCL
jgi:hypothetical protein